ncbi:MAG: hypothetical protein ACI9R3_005503 [Verrucomicrobiales bacterium]|jgi:hypothetical protein
MAHRRNHGQRKLELYSKFFIPLPIGFFLPVTFGMVTDAMRDPGNSGLLVIPFILAFMLVPTGFFQVIIGLPSISMLRGKSLAAHMLTGAALAILMVLSQGFGEVASEITGSMSGSHPDKFSNNQTFRDNHESPEPHRFTGRTSNQMLREQTGFEDIYGQIIRLGLPMMIGYLLIWYVFTSLPYEYHRELTMERRPANDRPIRNLRGEEVERRGKIVRRREKKRIRRSL